MNGAIVACPPAGWVSVAGVLNDVTPGTFEPEIFYLVGTTPAGGSPLEEHANEYTWFQSVTSTWQFCVPNDGDKLTVFGTCSIGCYDAATDTWIYDGVSPMAYTGLNLGAGIGAAVNIFEQVTVGGEFQFHTLLGGTNITLTTLPDGRIRIDAAFPAGGTGEANAGQNVGAGAQVYRNKTGTTLHFRTLVSSNPALTIAHAGDLVTFGLTFPTPPAQINNTGFNIPPGTIPVYKGMNGTVLEFHQLTIATEDALVFNAVLASDEILFNWSPSAGTLAAFGDALDLYSTLPSQGSVMHWNTAGLGSWEVGNIAITNVGTGIGVFGWSTLTSPTLQYNFRKLLAGANMSVGLVGNDIVFEAAAPAYTGLNLGSGNQVFSAIVGSQFQFRTLVMGTGMSAVQSATEIAISTTAENNSAANLGGGTPVYTGKVGSVFQLNTFGSSAFIQVGVAANVITFSPNPVDFIRNDTVAGGNELLIDDAGAPYLSGIQAPFYFRKLDATDGIAASVVAGLLTFTSSIEGVNVGGGVPVYKGLAVNKDLEFRSFVAGTNITLSTVGDTVVIDSTGLGGGVGASILSEFTKTTGTTTIDTTGAYVAIPFNNTALGHANITKSPNDEITFNVAGVAMISAKGTITPGTGRVQTIIRVMVDTGGGWTDLANSHGYGNSPNDYDVDHQTAHTGSFTILVGVGDKIQVQMAMSMGTLEAEVLNDATGITILLIS